MAPQLAFLFPGQGSQYAGMGKTAAEAYPEARAAFESADRALGFPLSALCFEGPEDELKLTENTQPAILATSVALLRVLEGRGLHPDFVAGHSLGEYSALVAARVLRLEDAVRLVQRRGRYMQEAVPVGEGAMAAILGLELKDVEAACREAAQSEIVAPANLNGPGQIVIAGHASAVARASQIAMAKGAKRAIPLPVSAPFHCRLMEPAARRLVPDLAAVEFKDPEIPVVSNVDAAPLTTGSEARRALERQVASAVRWQESVERLVSLGVSTFVEVGPGNVLTGLIRKMSRAARAVSVKDAQDVEKLLASPVS